MKIGQLVFTLILSVTFFLLLKLNPNLEDALYQDTRLFLISCTFWVLLIASYLFLLFDFIKLRKINTTNHELNKLAYLDDMTGIPNRYSCDLIFKMYRGSDKVPKIGCALLGIKNLADINLTYGYEQGSNCVQDFCHILEEVGKSYGFVGRNSGNEFLAVIEDCSEADMQNFLNGLQKEIDEYNGADHPSIEIAYAYSLNAKEHLSSFAELVTHTYSQMHNN